jgi:hypothetical protein
MVKEGQERAMLDPGAGRGDRQGFEDGRKVGDRTG